MEGLRELEPYELLRQSPGSVRRRVLVALCLAVVVTLLVPAIGMHLLWSFKIDVFRFDRHVFGFKYGLTLAMLGVLAVVVLPRGNRAIRLAVALPIAHVLAIVFAIAVWDEVMSYLLLEIDGLPQARIHHERMLDIALGYIGALAVFATLIALAGIVRQRFATALNSVVEFTLGNLLLLGVWLPVAVLVWCKTVPGWSTIRTNDVLWRTESLALAAVVVFPPMLVALRLSVRRARRSFETRKLVAIAAMVGVAIACRLVATPAELATYANLLPILVGAALVAALAVIVLFLRYVLSNRSPPNRRRGVIMDDGEPVVAAVEIASWVRGPESRTAPFCVRTSDGDLRIPRGATIVHAIPATTTLLRRGESVAVLRPGDEVFVDGFADRPLDHPFRTSTAPMPGPRGVVVRPVDVDRHPRPADALLAAWRPCVAYVLIVIAVALPAFASLPIGDRVDSGLAFDIVEVEMPTRPHTRDSW